MQVRKDRYGRSLWKLSSVAFISLVKRTKSSARNENLGGGTGLGREKVRNAYLGEQGERSMETQYECWHLKPTRS